jgi:Mn-dependent DtxR family transcriptional regulator
VEKQPEITVALERDRRDTARRAEVVRSVIEEIVHNGVPVLTIRDIETSLQVSPEAASRIVERLVSAGLLVESDTGTWVKVSL